MDRKSTPQKRRKGRRGPPQSFASIPKQVPTDTFILRTTYTSAGFTSGTDGTISSSISASIQSASEYSVLSSLYREVKLMSQSLSFFWLNPYATSGTSATTGLMCCGTDMSMNGTTFTSPTTYIEVYNCTDRRWFCRTNPGQITFRRRVPRDLEHTLISADCPTLPVPFAGSPGVIQVLSVGNNPSTLLTTPLIITATYHLRARV